MGMYFKNDFAVFGILDSSSGPISQKYEFSASAMPLASEKVTPSLMILFIRLPRFCFYYWLMVPCASTDYRQMIWYFQKVARDRETIIHYFLQIIYISSALLWYYFYAFCDPGFVFRSFPWEPY